MESTNALNEKPLWGGEVREDVPVLSFSGPRVGRKPVLGSSRPTARGTGAPCASLTSCFLFYRFVECSPALATRRCVLEHRKPIKELEVTLHSGMRGNPVCI